MSLLLTFRKTLTARCASWASNRALLWAGIARAAVCLCTCSEYSTVRFLATFVWFFEKKKKSPFPGLFFNQVCGPSSLSPLVLKQLVRVV